MNTRIFLVLALGVVGFGLVRPDGRAGAEERDIESQQDFQQRLEGLAKLPADACEAPSEELQDWNPQNTEYRLFSRAADIVTKALNTAGTDKTPAKDRAEKALKKLEAMSNDVNAVWPEENRFHFEILDVSPLLVVKMTIRTSSTYFVLGVPAEDAPGKANALWQQVGWDTVSVERNSARALVDLFPLRRGPSGNARFLAKTEPFGCAGSIEVGYEAREWDPDGFGSLREIIEQEGAFGLDDQVQGFEWIGELQTEGSLITLPFCQFSPIDTWDNPSLCAVDTYDVSGDEVRFVSRIYNRPDLLPIAKVIEYGRQHDYPAVRAYCASDDLAHSFVHDAQLDIRAEDVRVTNTGKTKRQVELGYDPVFRFEVEERGNGWVVVGFEVE